ncbi:MAG: hypothetical protein CFE33_04715 [Pseudorhodobacter sp. PARRP1]|nr:MAG: hypothetical protein CFE33_04715 [Pseudorhodobacter sp. PARRP1]
MSYPKAPILEAVVQLNFSHPVELKKIEAFGARAAKGSWSQVDRNSFKVTLEANTKSASASGEKVGIELRNEDSSRIIIFEGGYVLLSNLAPYPGWESFSKWILDELTTIRKMVGPIDIGRVGTRFNNRIDVSYDSSGLAYTESFISIHPQPFPVGGADFTQFYIGFTKQYEDSDLMYTLQCGTSESPVPGHVSISLDIDAYIEGFGAFNLDRIKHRLAELRNLKNGVFESAITDAARSLFGAS